MNDGSHYGDGLDAIHEMKTQLAGAGQRGVCGCLMFRFAVNRFKH